MNKSADFLFFSADANRSESREGKAWDRVLDPIAVCAEEAGFSCVIFAYPGSVLFGKKTFLKVAPLQQKEPSVLRKVARRGFSILASILPRRLPGPFFDPYNRFMAFVMRPRRPNPYLNPLATLKPKLVLATNANPLLCETAKALDIPVIEVLHARGYGRVYEAWETRPASKLPNGVIAYDSLSAKAFSKFVPVLQVPNYRYLWEKELAREWELTPEGRKYVQRVSQFPYVVTFTSNWGENRWGPEFIDGGIPTDLLRLVEEREDLFLQVRLHPVLRLRPSFRKRAKQLGQKLGGHSRIDFETASAAPIYSILRLSTVHLTYNSLSVYEATDDGLSSYCVQPELEEQWALDLIRTGIVKPLSPTRAQLEAAIENRTSRNSSSTDSGDFDLEQVLEWGQQLKTMKF